MGRRSCFSCGVGRANQSRLLANLDDNSTKLAPKRVMYIGSIKVEIKELDPNIETSVTCIILPNEDFSSLVCQITNTDASFDLTHLFWMDLLG